MKSIKSFALASGLLALGLASTAAAAPKVEHSGRTFHVAACSYAVAPGNGRCFAHLVTNASGVGLRFTATGHGHFAPVSPADSSTFLPVFPAQVRAAYGITGFGSSATTVAIVDAYGYPNAEADLNTFRGAVGLGSCTKANGCLKIVNQGGSTSYNYPSEQGWDIEQATDLDTVSTMCPGCKILLVQAKTANFNDLAAAVRTAAAMGARVISNSYGAPESSISKNPPFESAYNQPGIAVTASTGDSGYGAAFPADSPHVISVGGTSLLMSGLTRTSETVWSGSGSGCSALYGQPSWQQPSNANMANNTLCTGRMEADVSADADPNTGVIVYFNIAACDAYGCLPAGFYGIGGTSVANQIVAGIYGEKGNAVTYAASLYAAPGSAFYDITSGTNAPPSCGGTYFCVAGAGYDGPTGLGTPNGDSAF
jgi:subtilase family serine protease